MPTKPPPPEARAPQSAEPLFVVAVAAVDRAAFEPDELATLARQLTAAMHEALAATAPFSPRRAAKPRREPKLLLSRRAAALLLQIDRGRTLDTLIRRGLLKTVKVNGRVRVTRVSVEQLAEVGFDTNEPEPKPSRKSRAHLKPVYDPGAEILRLKF